MKLLLAIGVLVGAYTYFMMHATDLVLGQTKKLNATYQYVANNADRIAAGRQ